MNLKRLGAFLMAGFLAACGGGGPKDWGAEYGNLPPTGAPVALSDGFYSPDGGIPMPVPTPMPVDAQPVAFIPAVNVNPARDELPPGSKTVAALLPLSGQNSELGNSLQHSIEIAFFQRQPRNIFINFIDIGGGADKRNAAIANALSMQPDMIIGPIFSDDAKALRDAKLAATPALTFSSDLGALGAGVLTMALLPAQSAEATVYQMMRDGRQSVMIIAPDTASGYIMANSAIASANMYGLHIAGLEYYREGDTESMKSAAEISSMWGARSMANTRAKEVLSDMLLKEQLSAADRSSISRQLTAMTKVDAIGSVNFDSVLFLGGANDSKIVASFLRYYDVTSDIAPFYGTVLWDNSAIFSDLTMIGSKFSSLPSANAEFEKLYAEVQGKKPDRLNSMAYDAAQITMGALLSNRTIAGYLLDPSGFAGLDGLIRFRPNGTNERALQIMRLDGSGTPQLAVPAAKNFLVPIYSANSNRSGRPAPFAPGGAGINPADFIEWPNADLRRRYPTKSYGAGTTPAAAAWNAQSGAAANVILPEDDTEVIPASADYAPWAVQPVDKQLIDETTVAQ